MNFEKTRIEELRKRIECEFMPFVRRPSRYIGGEINSIKKDPGSCDLKAGLCFPDIYEVGMSGIGIAVLYSILNNIEGIAAERIFSPWTDAEKILREKKIPLFSLENWLSMKDFDVVGFSLTNELCYTNMLNALDLGGIEVRSSDRKESDPLIIAGGQMANSCEPIAEFVDLFVLGEGENAIVELMQFIRCEKRAGAGKKEILHKAAKKFRWVYVPSLYKFEYTDGEIKSFLPTDDGLSLRLENAVADDFENAAVQIKPIVPFAQAVHERVSIEIMRGCPGRCRFCQASFCKRPLRYRSIDKIFEIAKASYEATGFDTISLLSLSTADYPKIEELTNRLHQYFAQKNVGLSLPSLRVDQQLRLLPELVTSVRKGGLTIAVEAASENLRRVINKPLTNEDLFAAVKAAYKAGWRRIKLYFMVGLPGETTDDIAEIVQLAYKLAVVRREVDGKTGEINAAVSWFVPKPHTPFGFLAQKPKSYFEDARRLILDEKKKLRSKFLNFKFHHIECSILESAIGRADRRLCNVIEAAWRAGARFDLWDECFDYQVWQNAFEKFGMNVETIAQKNFGPDEILPWGHLGGPEKKYLLTHLQDAQNQMLKM